MQTNQNDYVVNLTRYFVGALGGMVIRRVDSRIFTFKYPSQCLKCSTCNDVCCSYGADIDVENISRLARYQSQLEEYLQIPYTDWFQGPIISDHEYPGGGYRRTNVQDGHCIFRNKNSRGCSIHSFCLQYSIDVHMLKPIISCLFPITWDKQTLLPVTEILDNKLHCQNSGVSLYTGIRTDLLFYYGSEFINVLDEMQSKY